MLDLSTTYLGLKLKNPIIIASSGLSNSVEKIKKLADNGAAAVVLKSLFEEQINHSIDSNIDHSIPSSPYPEALDYIANYTKEEYLEKYLDLISGAKKETDIPIIASINCVSATEWVSFAERIEKAGADAIELNVAILPYDVKLSSEDYEKIYFDILKKVKEATKVPLALKMSYYSAGLANLIDKLSWTNNVAGFVLFNRYYSPDIDIDNFKITTANIFSSPEEISNTLRWIALLSDKIKQDLAATTGIHDGKGVIKQLLAGAQLVQIASSIYKNGTEHITTMLKEIEDWMQKHGFAKLTDFRGKMSYESIKNPSAFERIQFMKYYSKIE